jgi:hypothetical protein
MLEPKIELLFRLRSVRTGKLAKITIDDQRVLVRSTA